MKWSDQMNDWERTSRMAERIRKMYPPGTRIELIHMGDDPRPIGAGERGTVVGVDDIGSIMMRWDSGRSLSLIPGEDSFRALTPEEYYQEKLEKMHSDFISAVNHEVIPKIKWKAFADALENGDAEYTADILRNLHTAFIEAYGSDSLSSEMGMVQVPALINANDGKIYPALVCIDTESSGEHWGTTIISPRGVFEQNDVEYPSEDRAFLRSLIPYDYYYTPVFEHDHHVDWDECPDEIRDILLSVNSEDHTEDIGLS